MGIYSLVSTFYLAYGKLFWRNLNPKQLAWNSKSLWSTISSLCYLFKLHIVALYPPCSSTGEDSKMMNTLLLLSKHISMVLDQAPEAYP
jgi:hypothetical protein